jgi:hypothetical protein
LVFIAFIDPAGHPGGCWQNYCILHIHGIVTLKMNTRWFGVWLLFKDTRKEQMNEKYGQATAT